MSTGSPVESRRNWLVNIGLAVSMLAALAFFPVRGACAEAMPHRPEAQIDRDEVRRLQTDAETLSIPSLGAPEPVMLSPAVQRQRLEDLRQTLNPVPEEPAALRIRALQGFLDYDEEDEVIYGPQRTQIVYGKIFLEADSVLMDSRIQEVQAEGNVILRYQGDTVEADSLRYNFLDGEGVGYNVRGNHEMVYFRAASRPGETEKSDPQLQKVSKTESIFRNAEITGCDFKVPHYHLKGREVILYQNDRVFVRSATLYVQDFPVLYLPVYSRSMVDASPWYFAVGWGGRTGARLRVGYSYTHRTEEPSLLDDGEYETRSEGRANIFTDYLAKAGAGAGVDYKYNFDFNRHRGEFNIYGLYDDDRVVSGAVPEADPDLFDEEDRGRVALKHYSQLADGLNLIVNGDWYSDPDIFYDVLDVFGSGDDYKDRERQPTRRARVALTYVREAYVVRLMTEIKDRVGIDQYRDLSNPLANNRDWDIDPGGRLSDDDTDGISSDRWGRVSVKAPQFDLATRHLPIGRTPLYYSGEIHLYNSLDKGLNVICTEDDAFVQGIETYHSLMYQYKLSQRYILLTKLGFGMGYAERDKNYDVDFSSTPFPQSVDNLVWKNRDTFVAGGREHSLDDINDYYFWGDMLVALNARFSDALKGEVGWRIRETTSDFIGEYYREIGDVTVREDLYNYKLREHWIEGKLVYTLARPLITVSTNAAYNLTNRGSLWNAEPLAYWNNRIAWRNQRNTFQAWLAGGWEQRQYYNPEDPRSYLYESLYGGAGMRYEPVHRRWFTSFVVAGREVMSERSELTSSKKYTHFTDEDSDLDATLIYGRELGPKWDTLFEVRWDDEVGGLREVAWMLQRDLHDALVVLRVSLENDEDDDEERGERGDQEIDVSLAMKVKLPNQYTPVPTGKVSTIMQRYHEPAVAY